MNYAIVENSMVTNIIWLNASNANEFAGAVALGDVPAAIGDGYVDGVFTRDGQKVLSPLQAANVTIAKLDSYVLELELESVRLTQDMK